MANMINTKREDIAAATHLTTVLVLLLSAVAIIALGVWGRSRAPPILLDSFGNETVDFAQRAPIMLISCGVVFLLASLTGLLSAFLGFYGRKFRLVYACFIVATLLMLVFIIVTSWYIAIRRYNNLEFLHYRESWEKTQPERICRLESVFQCRGFSDKTCSKPDTESCYNCATTPSADEITQLAPCYEVIRNNLAIVYYPSAIIATLLAIVIITDLFIARMENNAARDAQPSYQGPPAIPA